MTLVYIEKRENCLSKVSVLAEHCQAEKSLLALVGKIDHQSTSRTGKTARTMTDYSILIGGYLFKSLCLYSGLKTGFNDYYYISPKHCPAFRY